MHLKRISPNCLTTQTVYEGVRGAPGAVKIGIAQTQKDPLQLILSQILKTMIFSCVYVWDPVLMLAHIWCYPVLWC